MTVDRIVIMDGIVLCWEMYAWQYVLESSIRNMRVSVE